MITPGKIWPGTALRLEISFTDDDGDAVDPTTVTFKTYDPCGDITTYVYLTDSEITRASAGNYLADIQPEQPGRWRYRWQTTGTGTVFATEGDFIVQASPFSNNYCGCWDYR